MAVLSIAKIISRPGPHVRIPLMLASLRSIRQAKGMHGFRAGEAGPAGGGVFFAVSLWDKEEHVRAYAKSGAHGKAAARISKFAKAHVSGHLTWDEEVIPPIAEWGTLLRDHGNVIRLPAGQDVPEEELYTGPASRMKTRMRFRPKQRHKTA